MVNLEKESWLYSWYRFASWNTNCNSYIPYEDYEPKKNTDLCSFVNSMVWGTLGFIWDLAIWLVILISTFIIPGLTAGSLGYVYVVFLPVLVATIVVLLAWGASALIDAETNNGPVTRLVGAAYTGWKERFCPIVKFEEKNDT